MSFQFKAYLHEGKPCRSKEIRRFAVDHDVAASYDYLRQKVSNVFPNLGDNFALQWRDSDGDLIWFNSDEELMQALSLHTDGEFKLYIKEQSADSQQSSGPKYCGQRFSPYRTPFGFHARLFADCPASKSDCFQKDEHNKEKPSSSKPTEQAESSSAGKDYLEELNDVAIQFLKSFGIDVSVKTEQSKEKDDSEVPKSAEPTTSTASTSTGSEAGPSESASTSQWTIIEKEKTEEKSKNVDVQMEEVDEDTRIRESLDRLLGMGFNDDNGWLTNLLKSCSGDIGRALDAMQPNRIKKN